jgi:hypothetical protein
MSRQVALVRKTGRQRYLRQGQLRLSQQLLNMIQPPPQKITVRRLPNRLVKGARKMIPGKSGHGSERIEANSLVKMRFDVIADATCQAGRQSAAFGCRSFSYWQTAKCTDPWPGVDSYIGGTTPYSGFAERWRNQHAPPPAVATSTGEVHGNVSVITSAKKVTLAYKNRRQWHSVSHAFVT